MLGETVRVTVVTVNCPGESIVPSWSHVTVIGPFALAGFQLVAFMLKVSGRPVQLFLM